MLCLGERDIVESVSLNEIMDAVESTMILYEKREFHMPDRMHVDYEGNTLLLMPCFVKESFGTKLVTIFPQNAQKNIPLVNGAMILNDGETGIPLALINGSVLTALRTGAVGGVSIRHLTSRDVHCLGIIGAGIQGFHQALFATAVRKITDIYVSDCRPEQISSFEEKFSACHPNVRIHPSHSPEELLKQSQVVITATTSFEPVLPERKELLAGKHFVAIGSYKQEMRELPEALFSLLQRIFIDADHAVVESGDISIPLKNRWIKKDQIYTLGKLITGEEKRNENQEKTTLFKSVGMALFDVVVSKLIYERAVQKQLGQVIDF